MDRQVYLALEEWLIIKMKETLTPVGTGGATYSAGSVEKSELFMSEIFGLTAEELNFKDFFNQRGFITMDLLLDHINTNYPTAIAKAFKDGAVDYYFPDEGVAAKINNLR